MNTNIFFNYKALLMAVLMLALNTSQVLAEAGSDHRGGNGGLGLASEFSMIAKNVEIIWEDICSNSGEKVNYCDYLTDYKSLLNKNSDRFVTVLSKPDVVGYDGQPREASNNGIDQIVLNSRLWDQAKMARLVVHELASILYLDSSDYYGFTNELLSLFSRKKYDLNIITAKEILPNRCSVNFAGKDASTIAKYISPELSQSNYRLVNSNEFARFQVRVYSTCESEFISNTCGLFVQMVDNFKKRVVMSSLKVDNQNFTSRGNILQDLALQFVKEVAKCQ